MRTALAKTCPDCRLAVLVIHADRTRLVRRGRRTVRTAAGSRCYSGPAMNPLPQRSAEIKVEWLCGDWPWVSCKLSPVFSPPGWLLTDYPLAVIGQPLIMDARHADDVNPK